MNCKKIQGMLLTDYIDNQMDAQQKMYVEEHLAHCPACKEFLAAARKITYNLFSGIDRANPPELVWRNIKEAVAAEEQKRTNLVDKFFSKLKYAFYIPNPAIAFATILALTLVFGTITKLMVDKQELSKTNMQERIEYFDYSIDASADSSANDESGFGTSIEKYFL